MTHWQHAWFHVYLLHQYEMLWGLVVVPQGQLGQLFEGQLPPQVFAMMPTAKTNKITSFILYSN
jgi:hypothetical protein